MVAVKSLILSSLAIILLSITQVNAGFRCNSGTKWLGGSTACALSCKALGHTSGECDWQLGDCNCSEDERDGTRLPKIASRCDLPKGKQFCHYTCRVFNGRIGGVCEQKNGKNNCRCCKENMPTFDKVLCPWHLVNLNFKSMCTTNCQSKGFANGYCQDWNCRCKTNKVSSGGDADIEDTVYEDFNTEIC